MNIIGRRGAMFFLGILAMVVGVVFYGTFNDLIASGGGISGTLSPVLALIPFLFGLSVFIISIAYSGDSDE